MSKHVNSNYNFRVTIFDIDAGMRSTVLGCSRKSQRKSKELYFLYLGWVTFMNSAGLLPKYPSDNTLNFKFILWRYIDSRFGRILDVFIDSPITSAVGILVPEHHARWNCRSRHNVPFTLVATRIWVRGSTWHGKTSQAPFSHIAILLHPAQQNRMNKGQVNCYIVYFSHEYIRMF